MAVLFLSSLPRTLVKVELERLFGTNAIDWSVATRMGGQIHAITLSDRPSGKIVVL